MHYASYRRKWIAKVASLSEHFLSNQAAKDFYFGSIEMTLGADFKPDMLKEMPPTYRPNAFSFFHYEAPFSLFYPRQTDQQNCGIFSIWYMLLNIYNEKNVCQINTDQ